MTKTKTKTKTMISARVDTELNDRLEAIAEYSQRSKAFLISEALQIYVDRKAWLNERIAAAVKAADQEEHWISQEAMEKWVLSLGTPDELPPPEPDIFKPKRKSA